MRACGSDAPRPLQSKSVAAIVVLGLASQACAGGNDDETSGNGGMSGAQQVAAGSGGTSGGQSAGGGGMASAGGSSGGDSGISTQPAGSGEYPAIPEAPMEGGRIVVWDNGLETSFPCSGGIGPQGNIILVSCGWDVDHDLRVQVDLLAPVAPGTYLADSYLKGDWMALSVIADGNGIMLIGNNPDTDFSGSLVIEELGTLPGEATSITLQAKWPQAIVWANNQMEGAQQRPGSLAMRLRSVNP